MVTPLIKVKGQRLKAKGIAIFYLLPFTFYLLPFSYHQVHAQSSQAIRVALMQDVSSLSLKVDGYYEIIDPLRNKVISKGTDLRTTVAAYKDSILLGARRLNLKKVLIKGDGQDGNVSLDGRRFRGDIQFIRNKGKFSVVNHVYLEDYVKGILYHEASHYWPPEALKAQAVVCRTYALYQMRQNAAQDFDLTSDIYSQVYGGMTSERYRTNKAVEETGGEVIYYGGKIIPAYYHATCGGHTEDASMLWNIDIAPLKGVICGFCKESPHFNWHAVLSQREARDALKKAGYSLPKGIKAINISGRDASGRITDVKFISDTDNIKVSAKDLRNAIGPNVIRSANFTVSVAESDIVFEGTGWGHGVGMCQWGAYFMAKQGAGYKDILNYYYPKSDVKAF